MTETLGSRLMTRLRAWGDTPAARVLHTLCGDPVQMYAVFLVMTCMYYYHQSWTWLYTVIAILLSFVLVRFYVFCAKKGFVGSILYLVYLFAGLYGVSMLTDYGRLSYPLTFAVWFLTPQSVVDFSLIYTIAIYCLMIGFLTSTVYYFAKIRYRMTMQLLIMLIPLSFYAKESLHMPALMVIILLASYFLLMIYCRQLRETDQVRVLPGVHTGVSIAIYVAAFTILAAIVPKPAIVANREFIENAMSYSTWSDRLMDAISMFTEVTDNRSPFGNSNTRSLYYAHADEPLRLRTQTFSYYTDDGAWHVTDYDRFEQSVQTPLTYSPRALMAAIQAAAAQDEAFAEEYGLTDLPGISLPDRGPAELTLFPVYFLYHQNGSVAAPTRTQDLAFVDDSLRSGLDSYAASETGALQGFLSGTTFTYWPDSDVRTENVRAFLGHFTQETYAVLLHDAADVLAGTDPEASALLQTALDEYWDAYAEYYEDDRLDYQSPTIERLAAEITDGLDSDIERALAIERWFEDAGYLYDDSYQRDAGENVDDFLNDVRRGVCYEYATAMTLMCRSLGMPTRFATGYSLSEPYRGTIADDDGDEFQMNFVIKARDAHAFPEVYIAGYGWCSFEPTVGNTATQEATPENRNVSRWGLVLLVLAGLVFVGWLCAPWVRERLFRRDLQRMTAQDCAAAVFRRMREVLRSPESMTVSELAAASAPFYTEHATFAALDALLYSQTPVTATTSQTLAGDYVAWQEKRRTYEKEKREAQRAARREERKQARRSERKEL